MRLSCLMVMVCCTCHFVSAQTLSPYVISSSGGNSETVPISLDWTLGELAVQTIRTKGGILTEGFHQPHLKVEKVQDFQALNDQGYEIQIAPNPVHYQLGLYIKTELETSLQLRILSLNGVQLHQQKVNYPFENVQLNFEQYPSGMYLLQVFGDSNQLIQNFKVNKIN